ncbi:MAG: hypothetical protein ACRDLB_07285, partial [Actinomycetota bacterium]
MRRMLMVLLGACLVGGAIPAQVATAGAAVSPLGIKKIVYSGVPGGVGTLKMVTDGEFRCGLLARKKPNRLQWLFDAGRDGDIDLRGKFVCRNKKLMFDLKSKKNKYESLRAKRPSKDTIKVTFTFDLPELKSKHLNVTAKSKDKSSPGCANACSDTVGPLKAY